MTIKVSDLNGNQGRFVRETTAPFIINKDGKEEVIQLRVKYFAKTGREAKAFQDAIAAKEAAGKAVGRAEILLEAVAEFPDLVDDKDKPAKVTLELLESFNVINQNAIISAIGEDLIPKVRPPK